MIEIDIDAGVAFEEAVDKAKALSAASGEPVMFRFNGGEIVATHHSSTFQLYDDYKRTVTTRMLKDVRERWVAGKYSGSYGARVHFDDAITLANAYCGIKDGSS